MNSIAVYIGDTAVYWSSVLIVLGTAAGFLLSYSIYTSHSGRGSGMWVMLAFSIVLGVLLSRLIHAWCHQEQYDGLYKALTDYSAGSYFLPGALLGVMLAALLVRGMRFAESSAGLLDAAAPGLALTVAFIRLSALFTTACRSRITVMRPKLRRLPFASQVTTATGGTEYRFATFFFMFMLMLLAMVLLLFFYYRHHSDRMKNTCPREGHVFRLFLLLYCMTELVLDSTRFDSTFPYFSVLGFLNKYASFISLTQLFAAITILVLQIFYMKRSAAANGRKWYHYVLWVVYVLSLAGTGISEYMVQRHSNMYPTFYLTMSISVLIMAGTVITAYLTCRQRRYSDDAELY